MKYKTYTSKHFHYMTLIEVNGKAQIIEFKGGIEYGNYVRRGTYSTNNKDIQTAIERDKRFGNTIQLVAEQTSLKPQTNAEIVAKKPNDITVANFEQAIDTLKERGYNTSQIKGSDSLKMVAKEAGINFIISHA